jgi:threonine aldolase
VLADGGVPLETYRLAVTGTRANLIALRKWGEEHGITFKNIDE